MIGALLASCAGATDVLAFFALGKAFAGNITGNLVTGGYGVATGNSALIKPTATALAGCTAGEIAWAVLLKRTRTSNWLIGVELLLFLVVLTDWLANGSHPTGARALVLLAAVSVALGGQSIWALRIHQTTTYFTGLLTTTVSAAASGKKAGIATAGRQLGALVAGALLSGLFLNDLRAVAPAVPVGLLTAAALIHLVMDQPGACSS